MSAGDMNRRLFSIPPTHFDDDATTYEPADLHLYINFVCSLPKLHYLAVQEVPALRWNTEPDEDFAAHLPKLPASLRSLDLCLHPHIMDGILKWLIADESISCLTEVQLSSQIPFSPLPRTTQIFMDALGGGGGGLESVTMILSPGRYDCMFPY